MQHHQQQHQHQQRPTLDGSSGANLLRTVAMLHGQDVFRRDIVADGIDDAIENTTVADDELLPVRLTTVSQIGINLKVDAL